jgi:hypothetical protein
MACLITGLILAALVCLLSLRIFNNRKKWKFFREKRRRK